MCHHSLPLCLGDLILALRRQRQMVDLCAFEASLVYSASFRPARSTQKKALSWNFSFEYLFFNFLKVFVSVHACKWGCPKRPEVLGAPHGAPLTWTTWYGCWWLNFCLLEEQGMLLTTETSLHRVVSTLLHSSALFSYLFFFKDQILAR